MPRLTYMRRPFRRSGRFRRTCTKPRTGEWRPMAGWPRIDDEALRFADRLLGRGEPQRRARV